MGFEPTGESFGSASKFAGAGNHSPNQKVASKADLRKASKPAPSLRLLRLASNQLANLLLAKRHVRLDANEP
jgi:hypothetical protein